eukprot:1160135-Pelagomonas_calceolata.AAC.1
MKIKHAPPPKKRKKKDPSYYLELNQRYSKYPHQQQQQQQQQQQPAVNSLDDPLADSPTSTQPNQAPSAQTGTSSTSRPTKAAQERNRAAHNNWAGAFPGLVWQCKVFQGSEAKSTLPSKNEHFLRSMLRDAIEEQIACGCRYCNFGGEGGQECSMQPFPKRCITFVDMMGSLELEEPRFRCQKCHREHDVHPMSIGYFPATPMEPTVWFSEALMVATSKVCFLHQQPKRLFHNSVQLHTGVRHGMHASRQTLRSEKKGRFAELGYDSLSVCTLGNGGQINELHTQK